MGAGYTVGIKNVGTGVITVTTKTNTDTIDGVVQLDLTILPGDYQEFKVNAGNNGYIRQMSTFLMGPPGQCQLQFVDTTHITLFPYNGNKIVINGVAYAIPSAGVTALSTSCYIGGSASQAVAASTTYLVYAFTTVSAGVVTINLDLITGGSHATDANTGIEIKTGDATRTLVGMVLTDASNHFQAAPLTISWFNRQRASLTKKAQSSSASASNFTNVEIQSANRINFLSWTNSCLDIQASGSVTGGGGVSPTTTANLSLDSATPNSNAVSNLNIANGDPFVGNAFLTRSDLSEGLHYVTGTWTHTGLGTPAVSLTMVGSVSP